MPCTRRIYRWLKEHHLVTGSEQWRQLELWEGVDWSQWTTADSLYCASRTWRNTRWYTRTADWMSMEKQRLQVRVERSVFNDYRKTWRNFRFIQPTITYFKSAKIALIKILWCNFSWKCNTCSVCFNQSNITHVTFKPYVIFPQLTPVARFFALQVLAWYRIWWHQGGTVPRVSSLLAKVTNYLWFLLLPKTFHSLFR